MVAPSTTLRRGILSLLFGLMAAQGVINDAQAQDAPARPTADTAPDPSAEPQTQASRALESMRLYYARAARKVVLGALDTDRLYAAHPLTDDNALLQAAVVSSPGATPNETSLRHIVDSLETVDGAYSMTEGINLSHGMLAPVAVPQLHTTDGRRMCVVIATQPDIQLTIPTGLTAEQTVRYINRHEFHHCISRQLDKFRDPHTEIPAQNPDGSINPAAFRRAAGILAEETRADLGAAMDMIALDGDDTAVIHALAGWRTQRMAASQHDFLHYSAPALLALADRIEDMGLARFRSLSEKDRARMAERLIRQNTMSAGALALVAKEITHLDDATLMRHVRLSAHDHHRAAPALADLRANPMLEHEDIVPVELSPQQVADLRAWDIQGQLARRAAGPDGRMTRLGLLNARAEVLDALRRDLAADPSNPVHGARILLTHGAVRQLMHVIATGQPAAASVGTMCLVSDVAPDLCKAASAPAPPQN